MLALAASLFLAGCVEPSPEPSPVPPIQIEPVDLTGIEGKISFAGHYSLAGLEITPQVQQYSLPLQTSQITNYSDFSQKIPLSPEALSLLQENGFVVIDNAFHEKEENIVAPYNRLKDREIPIFITSDSLLHLYHIQFDETLRQIEEKEFYDAIWLISQELLADSQG